MTIMKRMALLACSLLSIACMRGISAATHFRHNSAGAPPRFEVASIKRSNARLPVDKQGYLLPPQFQFTPGGLFQAIGVTVLDVLTLVHPGKHQVEGGPAWIDSDRFDILARTEFNGGAAPSWSDAGRNQWVDMIGNLLDERFALKVHEEVRERSVLVLTSRGARTRLEQHIAGSEDSLQSNGRRLRFYGVSLSNFARYLSSVMRTPVVDGTGMTGLFDFYLDPYRFGADALDNRINANNFADLMMQAVQDIGFDLHRNKAAVTYTIIDNIEPPTEN